MDKESEREREKETPHKDAYGSNYIDKLWTAMQNSRKEDDELADEDPEITEIRKRCFA